MDCYLDPSAVGFAVFKALPRDEPIHMLNLLRFRDRAEYLADHPNAGKGWTGRQAYAEYGRTSGPIFQRVGGRIVWRGAFQVMVIGPEDRQWDDGFVAEYPTSAAFLEMVTDPEYRTAVINRSAAVLDSRLIRFDPDRVSGNGF
ncbi:DUF1330 domain-containing protein [Tsuneonella suprasediminis]|uniref:DUF1330 domain-containing protein n=1 Tax=Tsuneonella suprasediminis TaxID=2306996 RepID=UPI002F9243DB